MATLDQARALLAFDHITEVKGWDEAKRKKYASMVHSMPALLRSAGLSQALHFVHSRKSPQQKALLGHLSMQLKRVDNGITNEATLLARVRGANLATYLRLTHEAHASINWYRRFVQGELGIEAGSDVDAE